MTTSLSALIGDAGLDPAATQTLQLTVDTLGPAIQAGLGDVTLDDITASEVVLVTQIIDDSSSIRFVTGNTEAVRSGHNLVIDALAKSKQSADVLASCTYLNGGLLYPYVMLADAVRLTAANYNPYGGTPLFTRTMEVLAEVTAKMADFENGGVAARALVIIVTDGADTSWSSAQGVAAVVNGLLRTEKVIVAGIGIDDGSTDFNQVFAEMGIRPEWVLTAGNSPSEIRAAFQVVSQSAVRASQTAGSFSQTAMGGFGA